MSELQRSIRFLLVFAVISVPIVAAAQRPIEKGESTISGRVIFADTGKPVRRASVRLYSRLNYPPERLTPANSRGEFRFNEVAAGTYFVVAEAPNGVSSKGASITEFGVTVDTELDHTLVSVDGKGAVRCEVRVQRGGTIRGTIVYSDKEPVTGANISLFRRKNGATLPFFTDEIFTNDRGMYRIDGLPEGEYFVGVVNSRTRFNYSSPREVRSVVTAYYPGVASITEARSIPVQPGTDANGINLTLGDDDVRQISGVIKWRDSGKTIANTRVTLRRKDEPRVNATMDNVIHAITPPDANNDNTMFRDVALMSMIAPPGTQSDERGEWKFEDVPPGAYLITAYVALVDRIGASGVEPNDDELPQNLSGKPLRMIARQLELTVGDEDLKNVVFEITGGGRISGLIVAEESPGPMVRLTTVRKGSEFVDDVFYEQEERNSFVLNGVPSGELRFGAHIPWDDEWYVKSITLGSQDLMRNSIRVTEGAEIAGVRVTLAKGQAKLTGRVQFDHDGSLAGGAGVLLVRSDPELWYLQSSRVFASTDPAGEFFMTCAPGDYLVFTWPAEDQPMQAVQEFVRSHLASARRITLQSREEKRIDFTVTKPKK